MNIDALHCEREGCDSPGVEQVDGEWRCTGCRWEVQNR